MSDSKAGTKTESRAVALARAHLEAWTNHDLDTARRNLAEDVQFYSPAANLVGIDEYMDAPRGLTQFARQVVPGSLRVMAAMGDERNALIIDADAITRELQQPGHAVFDAMVERSRKRIE